MDTRSESDAPQATAGLQSQVPVRNYECVLVRVIGCGSPKQVRGTTGDLLSDLWAFAISPRERLTGKRPLYSQPVAVLEQSFCSDVQRFQNAEDLPDGLGDICA